MHFVLILVILCMLHKNNETASTNPTKLDGDQKTPGSPASISTNNNSANEILIAVLAGYGQSKIFLGALPLAVEEINKDPHLLPGKKLTFKSFDIGRLSSIYRTLPLKLMTTMREQSVAAFIGPDETCTSEALLATAWNIPMLSYKCADTAVSNKLVFGSFARTLAPASKVSKSVVALLCAFHWTKFVIVASVRPAWGTEVAQAIKVLAEIKNLTVTQHRVYKEYIPTHISEMQKIVDETFETTRIYVFVGEHIAMVDFVRCLENRKLLDTGDYMVISVDDEIYDPTRRSNNIMQTDYLDSYIKRVRIKSFFSVLKLTPSYPSNQKFHEISENIKLYSRKPPFSVPFHDKISQNMTVPIYGAYLYDSIKIYARAATEVINEGGNIRDGKLIMNKIYNRSYHSVQGFDVYIDANGDAEGNFTVIALQKDVAQSLNKTLKFSMQPVGYFIYNESSDIPEFKYIEKNQKILWLKRKIPLSEPVCGFYGELCTPKKLDWRYCVSGLFMALFVAVIGAFLIKYYRYEQEIACLLWKVDLKEVTLICNENLEGARGKNMAQTCRHSIAITGETIKQAYTSIGVYRGNIVAVKRIHKRSIDLDRNIRKELKQMRDVRHENIIAFIGASVETGSIAILTSYCARGSLEDVLANEDLFWFFLDHMFISSLVSDILKGMIYLHDSEIGAHGNLRSSNCLVDSRWVCQITDFGLHEFRSCTDDPNKDSLELKRSLWMPPEILRNPLQYPKGTQKGDVYAFGIVLYEIMGRSGPWGETKLPKEEILHRVKNPAGGNIFRPPIRHLNVPDYIKQCLKLCWDEDPDVRPDIRLVRVKLKEMQAGLKPNIFDNMLAIMEKYACNLESLIQDRTNQLMEEKKKTEALLLRMLPKTVAESLKRGERVEAECFDCVTIFFSDLVGFTELCAQSNPFEVVEMLNDLYTCCDSIISNYEVYKVETIGDAYMVVSGLPVRNRNRHAGEIAALSLHLLDRVSKLEIRHRPGELLQIRIGIHSGQCVAGVVGLKMPRYCLFGDTVNTASRMESSGEALRIHISSVTYQLLKKLGGYICEERGLTFIKGKGEMRTYWLKGEDSKRRLERMAYKNNLREYQGAAPDLIRTDVTPKYSPVLHQQTSNYEYLAKPPQGLSRRGRLSVNDAGATFEQQAPLSSLPNFNNKELLGQCCYYCQKRKILSLAENEHTCLECSEVFKISPTIQPQQNTVLNKCTCKHPISVFQDSDLIVDCAGGRTRSPRSAPHITFLH